jgi:SAM-dependent methyltransferase
MSRMSQPVVVDEAPGVQAVQFSPWFLPSSSSNLRQVLDTVNDHHRCVYNVLADEYEKKSSAHVTTTQDRVNEVAKYIAPGSEILDVGCGVGLALLMLSSHKKEFRTTGVDISPRMVELARQRSPRTKVILGDFLAVDFCTEYDAIWEQALLHLFPSIAEDYIFDRFRQLLKSGGFLSLSTTLSQVSRESWAAKRDYETAPMRYRRSITEAELKGTLAKHRFRLLDRWETTDPFGKNWLTIVSEKQ